MQQILRKTTVLVVSLATVWQAGASGEEFERLRRPGSVQIEAEYNLTNLSIPEDQIHTLLPRDAIPALTDPKTEAAAQADWLTDDARVIVIVVGKDVLGVPLRVLDWHEIVNTTVGGDPIAATYCPLCDSATVFSRKISPASGTAVVLEFGVSGALFNSNVLMYDRRDKGLWSQLGMQALSGPMAGTSLDMLPVQVVSFAAFKKTHPEALIVSKDTGYDRDYSHSPYEHYFKDEGLMVPVAGVGDALPRKTLGVGIAVGVGDSTRAWFVPIDAIGSGRTIETPAGKVRVESTAAGVAVTGAPDQVRTAQTFYYSWSAFYPNTEVVRAGDSAGAPTGAKPGLNVGTKAPDVTVITLEGESVQLSTYYSKQPLVLTFYRGGWCPICTKALSGWQSKLDELTDAGAVFLAVAPEKTENAQKTKENGHLAYTVVTDPSHDVAKAFGVHFTVDDETRAKYKGFGLDVAASNTSGTWELPAPATFVIDRDGVIRYAFADWDYRKRADPDEVLEVIRSLDRP